MEFALVAEAVRGVPYIDEAEGRRLYDHLRAVGARDVLELGTAHGASAAYMAAALDANGGGTVTTIEHVTAVHDPPPEQILADAGLVDRVEILRLEHSSYTWWLKEQVERQSDPSGNCEPLLDFCYVDGAHNFTIDGLAVVLVEKLLRPGGWLLLDDLNWIYRPGAYPPGQGPDELRLSTEERQSPHMRAVFELIVKQHPGFSTFRIEDESWGWAQKAPGEPRRYEVTTTTSISALALRWLKGRRRATQSRLLRDRPK